MDAMPNLSRLRLAMISVPKSKSSLGLPEMNPSSLIRRIRLCRERKSALSSQRRAREILKSEQLVAHTLGFSKTDAIRSGWGTLFRPDAVVRLRRRPALLTAFRPCAFGLQGNTAELESRAAG